MIISLHFCSFLAHKIPQFVYELSSNWTSIVHGSSIVYPNFEIVARTTAPTGDNINWWCQLQVNGSVLKSNKRKL